VKCTILAVAALLIATGCSDTEEEAPLVEAATSRSASPLISPSVVPRPATPSPLPSSDAVAPPSPSSAGLALVQGQPNCTVVRAIIAKWSAADIEAFDSYRLTPGLSGDEGLMQVAEGYAPGNALTTYLYGEGDTVDYLRYTVGLGWQELQKGAPLPQNPMDIGITRDGSQLLCYEQDSGVGD
jgi:hypothetical protein